MMKLVLAIVGVAVLIFLIVLIKVDVKTAKAPSQPVVEHLAVNPTDPFKGPRQAKVVLIMVGSFTCDHCRQAAIAADQLLALYPRDLKLVWKDLPESSNDSYDAARAGRCAQLQGKFWPYHDQLYLHPSYISAAGYHDLAESLELELDEFDRCMDNRLTMEEVNGNTREALAVGIDSVPYLQFNDDTVYVGSQDLGTLKRTMEALLISAKTP